MPVANKSKDGKAGSSMRFFKVFLVLALAVTIAACAPKTKFLRYNGPEVTSVQVHKSARKMYLLHNGKVLESYDVALGFAPAGHKQFEGDGKTPEGTYYITHQNPNSASTSPWEFPIPMSAMSNSPKPLESLRAAISSSTVAPVAPSRVATGPKAASP
jgi:hypothetical protein